MTSFVSLRGASIVCKWGERKGGAGRTLHPCRLLVQYVRETCVRTLVYCVAAGAANFVN